jgi:hypothetical protein
MISVTSPTCTSQSRVSQKRLNHAAGARCSCADRSALALPGQQPTLGGMPELLLEFKFTLS